MYILVLAERNPDLFYKKNYRFLPEFDKLKFWPTWDKSAKTSFVWLRLEKYWKKFREGYKFPLKHKSDIYADLHKNHVKFIPTPLNSASHLKDKIGIKTVEYRGKTADWLVFPEYELEGQFLDKTEFGRYSKQTGTVVNGMWQI
ncbi:hypothetical protein KJA13_03060, partial [Patescibacteria group bacterium]|nr:hypothetical protein [Patescibacteria group bacterium]